MCFVSVRYCLFEDLSYSLVSLKVRLLMFSYSCALHIEELESVTVMTACPVKDAFHLRAHNEFGVLLFNQINISVTILISLEFMVDDSLLYSLFIHVYGTLRLIHPCSTGPKGCGFKTRPRRWIFNCDKNPQHTFLSDGK
jgi:hypothetical protein